MGGGRFFFIVLSFVLACPQPLAGQPQGISFEHLSLEQGLSQSSVYAIVQDKQGFMWFGTQDGLNKYDGYTFTVYRHDSHDPNSLSHNYIRRLLVARDGTLWIGTQNAGVNCFNPADGRFTRFLHNAADSNSLSDNAIWALLEDRDGLIWVGTHNGLNSYNRKTRVWTRYYASPGNRESLWQSFIRGLFQDPSGLLWIGHERGVSTLDPTTGRFNRIHEYPATVNRFLIDQDGAFWTAGEVIRLYDSGRGLFQPYRGRLISGEMLPGANETELLSRTGDIWFGSIQGLIRMQGRSKACTLYRNNPNDPASLSENSILSLCEDNSGILWIGTFQGVNKYVPTRKKFKSFTHNPKDPGSLSSLRVRGFSQDPTGAMWIATQDGLNRFDPAAQTFTRYFFAPRNPVRGNPNHSWTVVAERDVLPVTVWAGTNGEGITKLILHPSRPVTHPEVRQYYSVKQSSDEPGGGNVIASYQDRSGDLWFGFMENGVSWYGKRTGQFRHFSHLSDTAGRIPLGDICCIIEDSKGIMWFGSYGSGVSKLDRSTMTFTRYNQEPGDPKSLSDESVLAIHEDDDGVFWFGTNNGLNRFDPVTTTFRTFTTNDGLANNVIYAILEDGHANLWLSSNKGLTKFNRKTFATVSYDVNDGLQSNEFNQGASYKCSDGVMFFGGINGFNVFHPDSIRGNPNVPRVVLCDFKISNKSILYRDQTNRLTAEISYADTIFLGYNDNIFSFEFAALEYVNSSRNQYAYRMDGFDKDWTSAGAKREATYTNLDPGTYTFRVKASNNDGMWNEAGSSIVILIAPPWWMTWWFRLLLAVSFLSFGPAFYFRRVSQLKKEYAVQQEFSRRLIEQQESERKRIAAELHDGLGQDLLVIKNRTYMAQQVKGASAKVKEQLDHIAGTVTQSLHSVREIALNLRPYHLDRVGLTGAVRSMLENLAQSSGVVFESQIDGIDGLFPGEAKDMEVNVFRIVQESTNNILKHSNAKHAMVRIRRTRDQLNILIQDDGKGFDVSSVHSPQSKAGLGLSGLTERVRILGGISQLDSSPGGGTKISIDIPLSHEGQT